MSTTLRFSSLVLLAFSVMGVTGSSVTPVQKVVTLLKGLEKKVEEDGKEEAAAYDKYACFCKEQVDEKIYAIEKSEAKEKSLYAKIQDLSDDLAQLTSDISKLTGTIDNLEKDIKKDTAERDTNHKAYLVKEADVSGAIDAVKRAISELKSSKGDLSGKTKMESDALAQIKAAARKTGAALTTQQLGLLSVGHGGRQPGEAYEYEYHANDIIATLEGLLVTFKDNKERLDLEEFNENSAFEKKRLAMQNQKTFAEEDKLGKEKLSAAKEEEMAAKQAEHDEEKKDRKADQSFLKVLQTNCEEKAKAWDQRSQTRQGELTAISKAMDALEKGVVPNYGANRKLVDLQQGQKVSVGAAAPARGPPSFLQLRGSGRQSSRAEDQSSRAEGLRQRVLQLLSAAASRLASPALSVAALKIETSKDHFVKVRVIIKDIIAKLEDQAKNEATTKSYCDTNMAAALKTRDAKKEELENLGATVSSKEAEKATLKSEIAALSEAIAENVKAVKEAGELRAAEKADNEKVVAEAKEGKAAVEFALKVLKDFYTKGSLVQTRTSYVPPDSDRSGKTVEDLAPEGFDSSEYKGRQESSKGILGLLEVILADFDRTDTTVSSDEKLSEQDFLAFKDETEKDTKAKEDSKTKKEGEVTAIDDELVTLQVKQGEAQTALDNALKELEKLQAMCVAGEETYAERVAKREKEIAALKEAHAILEDWQG